MLTLERVKEINADMDTSGKLINRDPNIDDIIMLAQTKGVNVAKRTEDMKYDIDSMRECIYMTK